MSASEKKLEKLNELFEGVDSLEDLQRKLETLAERELVRRASVLRHFDEEVYRRFLTSKLPGEYAANFEEFVRNFNVELVPRTSNLYRVKEDARRPCLDELRGEQRAGGDTRRNNDEVFAALLDYYEKAGAGGELDRLALLIIVNPGRAQEELERLYAEADARFDMARCNDLLRIFEVRTQLLDESLKLFCQDKRQYYNARNLYAADFYQTAAYLARGTMSEDFGGFLQSSAEDAKWIYHIYATGGLGKTMFVRWLISRCCVPAPRRVPVARLDFDMLDLTSASRYPLLLLLPIAEQLDQQIAGRPFNEPFKTMWMFRPLLDRPTGGERDAKRYDLEQSYRLVEPQWLKTGIPEFIRALSEARFTGPIVIAIDTLEEMLLLCKESLAKVVTQLGEMHKEYPALRVVLSGRYDLRDGLKGLEETDDMLRDHAVNYELQRFTPPEAWAYMTEKRGLKDDPQLVEAIVNKCSVGEEQMINPFILSLMADLVVSKDIRTVEDVRRLPRAEVAYLIKRIVERINDNDIRWMLRYASVPRLFTLELLEKVMWPHLLAEREELRGMDSRRKAAGEEYDQTEYFPPGGSGSAAEAWDKLKPYVSSYGWISFDMTDGTRMRLHPDVSVPMRLLVSDEKIYPQLHRDAARYFEMKADAVPEQWADWVCEAVYHRFQLDGSKAGRFWREKLGNRRAESDMEVRMRVASEITRRDYVDENGLPLRWQVNSEETIVAIEDLCEACHEAAVASIMLTARHSQGTGDYAVGWETAARHLMKLRAVLKAEGASSYKPRFDVEVFDQLAAELSKTLLDYDRVLPLAERALSPDSTSSLFLKLSLTIQLAEMYAGRDAAKAESYFKQALDASKLLTIAFLSTLGVTLKLAQWYQEQGRFADALAAYEDLLERRDVGGAAARNVKRLMAKANLEVGRYNTAARLSRESLEANRTAPGSDEEWDGALMLNRLYARELLQPLTALRDADALLQAAQTAGNTRRLAEITELRGYALGQLMQFEESLTALGHAKELWEKVNDPDGADRTRMYRVEINLNQMGDFNHAASLLSQWEAHSEKKNAELTCQMELLSVRCQLSMGREGRARENWEALANSKNLEQVPRSLIRTLAAGVAHGFGGPETLERLLAALEKIEPPSARLPLLAGFDIAGEGDGRPFGALAERLVRLVEWPPEKKETVTSALVYSQLLRWSGDGRKAQKVLSRAAHKSMQDGNSFAFVRVLSALDRLAPDSTEDEPPPRQSLYDSTFLQDYEQYPALRRAALLEEAERALTAGAFGGCEAALNGAAATYPPSTRPTKWDALATEVAACLAEQTDDRQRAESNLNVAASIYARLGDERSAALVKSKSPDTTSRGPLEASPEDKRVKTLRLEVVNDAVVVTSIAYLELHTYTPLAYQHLQVTQAFAATPRDRAAIFQLTNLMTNGFHPFRQTLWEVLSPALPAPSSTNKGAGLSDLRLEIPAAGLTKIPWELASFDAETGLDASFRHVYRGVPYGAARHATERWVQLAARVLFDATWLRVDGILGPQTAKVLEDAGLDPGQLDTEQFHLDLARMLRALWGTRPRQRTLVITPSLETNITAQRGFESIEDVSLRHLYESSLEEVRVVEVDEHQSVLTVLPSLLEEFRPQLIHIESAFKASPTTGQVYLDFNVETYSHDAEVFQESDVWSGRTQISPVLLNDMLLKYLDSEQRPLLVIEAQTPPGESAAALQLLLRNSFASELFHLGNTYGVVATGLFPSGGARGSALAPFIEQVSTGSSLGDAVKALNAVSVDQEARNLLEAATTALFTENPLITLLPQ